MNPRRIFRIASVLVKSQLRSGRSGSRGASLFNNPRLILYVDMAVFALFAGLVYAALRLLAPFPADVTSLLDLLTLQVVTSLPAFIPPAVFIAAVMFELSVSSKFASSDVINWLPVSQTDYVSASSLSVFYMYSFVPAIALGATLPLAARVGLLSAWGAAAVLCLVSLFATGALVEMMRAAINRVTSMVYGRAKRGTVVIRLVVTVLVILVVELGFNPVILGSLIGTFTGVVSVVYFVPFFWSSISVSYLVAGEALYSAAFFALSVVFALAVLVAAVNVRSRYWSPIPVTIEVSESVYSPHAGFLQALGLSAAEAAIVRKDVKGYTRRRELMPYLAIPFVFGALAVVQYLSTPGLGSSSGGGTEYPSWLMGGIMALLVAATSVGQEGKAILNMYASPITPRTVFRAKLLVSSLFGWATAIGLAVVSSAFASVTTSWFLASLCISIVIALECTLIGLGVGARFPDLQERPRPRFVQTGGMLLGMLAGMVLAFINALPLVVWPFMGDYLTGIGLSFGVTVGLSLCLGGAVSAVAYRWAKSGAAKLMSELVV